MMGNIIKGVVVTEKAYSHKHSIVVNVDKNATKQDIAAEFKKLYGDKVQVKSVNIAKLPLKTGGAKRATRRLSQKRAYITVVNKDGFDFLTFK